MKGIAEKTINWRTNSKVKSNILHSLGNLQRERGEGKERRGVGEMKRERERERDVGPADNQCLE